MSGSPTLSQYVQALNAVFHRHRDKREAHDRARQVLGEMAADDSTMTAILTRHLETPGTLGWRHYPVLGIEVEHNPYYTLVANCWIPLPDRDTDVSTKTVHHHGNMLLTTATCFGPGYEHWTFTKPELVDPVRELYTMRVLGHEPHPRGHLSFVDAFIAHCPFYPDRLSVTLALWSNQFPTSWRDVIKRLPMLKGHEASLRRLAARFGLTRALDLKVIEYFDFFPTDGGFKGMRQRQEFPLGPNEDYRFSLFHVLQTTGNERLAAMVEARLAADEVDDRPTVMRLLDDLKRGRRIEGRLSAGHHHVEYANFTRSAIETALGAPRPRASGVQY